MIKDNRTIQLQAIPGRFLMRSTHNKSRVPVILSIALLVLMFAVPSGVLAGTPAARRSAAADPSPPSSPAKLIFIHHSCGENWLADGDGGLGIALRDGNYFVSDTNYGWGPDGIGDNTDLGHWWTWFRGPGSSTYTAALYAESAQNSEYSRLATDPGGQNEIIMFKSCYPNSDVTNPASPVPAIGSNPLKGTGENKTFANAKGIYIDLLEYFKTKRDKLFVAITAPPMETLTEPDVARAWNDWLVNDWLDGYLYDNVFVFDFYNVLTSNGGDADTNDLGDEAGNHHRWWDGAIQHKTDDGANVLAYPTAPDNDHPTSAGNRKATAEYLPLLNVAYNRFKSSEPGPNPPDPSDYKSIFYFAEGTTRGNFQEYLCVANPNASAATVWVTYMFTDGTTDVKSYSVPASSRYTIDVNQVVGADRDVSMRVGSVSEGIVAERPMYFNYNGAWTGGHDVVGATTPSISYYFAEGTTRPNFDSYFCIQNPTGSEAPVKITYMLGDGTTREQELAVPPTSRQTVVVKDFLGSADDEAHDFSATVDSVDKTHIIAERPMYFNYREGVPGYSWTGGHDVIGAIKPYHVFYFAEGTTRPGFEPYFCIQNPRGDYEAEVNITYMLGDGMTREQTVTVPPTSRKTVIVRDFLGSADDAAHDFSAKVEEANGLDIIAERPMYFNYQGPSMRNWTGGHDVVGANEPDTRFFFAEGTARPDFDPYFCIQNPTPYDALVEITYYLGDGQTREQGLLVGPMSRQTIVVKDFLGSADDAAHDFSAKVMTKDETEILVERPMYFNYGGAWTGGHDVIGLPQ